jgi:hypothetical protein
MTKVTYEIVEHDGGWAYRADGVFSETFPSHDEARSAGADCAGRSDKYLLRGQGREVARRTLVWRQPTRYERQRLSCSGPLRRAA